MTPFERFPRRQLLQSTAVGFGYLALASLMSEEAAANTALAERVLNPLAPRQPHHAARAKRVIFLFMAGGPSQVDTFDHKPLLDRDHGKPLPFAKPRVVSSPTGNLLRSPFKFRQHGQSGAWVSELFPHLATCVADLWFLMGVSASHSLLAVPLL